VRRWRQLTVLVGFAQDLAAEATHTSSHTRVGIGIGVELVGEFK